MQPFEAMRDALRTGTVRYEHLDAAQLVKHAFGLVTQGRALGKKPVLYYLFAEPAERAGRIIPSTVLNLHRAEITDFARRVDGAAVIFACASYREWLARFDGNAAPHATALLKKFAP